MRVALRLHERECVGHAFDLHNGQHRTQNLSRDQTARRARVEHDGRRDIAPGHVHLPAQDDRAAVRLLEHVPQPRGRAIIDDARVGRGLHRRLAVHLADRVLERGDEGVGRVARDVRVVGRDARRAAVQRLCKHDASRGLRHVARVIDDDRVATAELERQLGARQRGGKRDASAHRVRASKEDRAPRAREQTRAHLAAARAHERAGAELRQQLREER
mmetsp:Transcript_9471/g.29908  ORF Transcript_9471/g.29908 Transcript_9471/m.29908 type:complete len:217 (-) Transcript_9471:497-1147(-)